jgi:hypothetical protein
MTELEKAIKTIREYWPNTKDIMWGEALELVIKKASDIDRAKLNNFGTIYNKALASYENDPEMPQLMYIIMDSSDIRGFCHDICRQILESTPKEPDVQSDRQS